VSDKIYLFTGNSAVGAPGVAEGHISFYLRMKTSPGKFLSASIPHLRHINAAVLK
jgi:hypothetical protein